MLEFKPNLNECVERMRRFWNLESPLDRVPALISLPGDPEWCGDGTFFGRLDDYIASQERAFRLQMQVPDESIPMVHPQYGHALIAALCGGPIVAGAGTVWAVPFLRHLAQAEGLHLDWGNEWGQRFLADVERLRQWSRGRCALANYEVEGVADTMSALRGSEQVMLDAQADSEGLRRFAERVTDILVEFGRWSSEHIGATQDLLGGETTGWRVWMPAGSMCFAEDATVMYSPAFYRRHIQPHDGRLTSAFSKTILEVHHEGNHQIAAFGEVPGVSLMTIESLARMQPEHRETLRQLLGRRCFLFFCRPDEVDDLLAFTGTTGVMLGLHAPDVAAAKAILNDLKRATPGRRLP